MEWVFTLRAFMEPLLLKPDNSLPTPTHFIRSSPPVYIQLPSLSMDTRKPCPPQI